ncbi:transporter family-2 protein [Acetoanaerobium pronyense]|uniref:Transporter family-2 protein n=1 Tax=Acetoanaerobium pronyense TaxID=1482736 RepID=A0ABS4KIC3_9FIRM|nr:DMT family transporter [Acetoanaerobium pronyense]MBP2027535.1 transporter family-2 protein [Acetoanaerobium pronyense]
MFYFIFPAIAGISIVIARILNSNLAKIIGIFPGTFFNFLTGLTVSSMLLLFSGQSFFENTSSFNQIPVWVYFGGILGLFIVSLSNYITPKISAFYLTILMFIGQLFTGIIIDFISMGSLSVGKIAGGLFVLFGLSFNLYMDKKKEAQNVTNPAYSPLD